MKGVLVINNDTYYALNVGYCVYKYTFVRPDYRSCSTLLVVIVLRLVGPLQEHIG